MTERTTRADTILLGADIVTMDPLRPRAAALAIRAGRIVAIGSEAEMRDLAGQRTEVLHAGGRLVLPGFQDTHIHLQDSGQNYSQNADLTDCRTPDEIVARLSAFAAASDAPWVRGVGWYSGIFGPHNLDAALLDRAVPDRPCLIVASDGHNGCINSAAISATGLAASTPDPLNGHFVRDGAGQATGHLFETAVMWVEARMPEPGDDDYAAGVLWAQALAHRHGITGVLDAKVEERHVRVYNRLAANGDLSLHVAATALVTPEDSAASAVERLSAFRASTGEGRFRVHSAKFFLDGVLENRTGAMIAPYSDRGDNAPLMFSPAQIAELFPAVDAARFQIHVHAIGDLATRAALDGIEAARRANGAWPALHQIAHVQCLDPLDAPRFRALGAMPNIQPLWARHEPSVTEVALPMVGPGRGRWMYAFRSLIDAGARLALSSDWGVSTLNPFEIIETAVTRQPPRRDGSHPVFLPEQRLTVPECVAGYTVNAAAAAWRPDTGSLSPGQCADFIVLDRDIFTCDPRDIGDTKVVMTVVAGVPVHREI